MHLHGFGPDVTRVSLSAALPQQAYYPGVKSPECIFHITRIARNEVKPNRYQSPVFQPCTLPSTAKTIRKKLTFGAGFVKTRYNLPPTKPDRVSVQFSSFCPVLLPSFLLTSCRPATRGAHSRVALLEILPCFFLLEYVCG